MQYNIISNLLKSTTILEEAGDRRTEKAQWITKIGTEKDRRWDKKYYDAFNTCVFTGKTFEGLLSPLAR